jgi:UDP-perosamine 4-acetyltransferase
MSARRTLLVGASGHAKVCLEILRADPTIEVVGCVSVDGLANPGLSLPVLGVDEACQDLVKDFGLTHVFVAIGDNVLRSEAIRRWTQVGLRLVSAVAPSSVISESAFVGPGSLIGPGAIVNAGARLGIGVIVNSAACVEHDCHIDDFGHIGPGAILGGWTTVGQSTLVGIGARVLLHIDIGANVVVGAGSVVTRSVPPDSTVVGVPGRVISCRSNAMIVVS